MSFTSSHHTNLDTEVESLLKRLSTLQNQDLIQQALQTLIRIANSSDVERLDWKILNASLQDMERAFEVFSPYRHTRKVAIFGSARLPASAPAYQMAVDFARCVTQQGYMVMTGGGGGIMEAANHGAEAKNSFGLNIQLPFEQGANPYIHGDPKLIEFKYFFTRKLFFLREADALALFPGGFGTQDEAFECITLTQTGKSVPMPLILIDSPGGSYWRDWDAYIRNQLLEGGLISSDDTSLYTITDNLAEACEAISSFYRVYHSSRYVGEQLVIRLKSALSDLAIAQLNTQFKDILLRGRIERSDSLAEEKYDETAHLPRLLLYFNQRDLGRLYQLISEINRLGSPPIEDFQHPERK
jgi:uncharacterized protein (TIGR00730 family)